MPKQHLIKLQPTEAEQYAYCKSIGCCFECEWCVGYSESMPKLVPYKKAKIIETKPKSTEFDNLAQNIAKNKKYGDFDHPLWESVIQKFIKGE